MKKIKIYIQGINQCLVDITLECMNKNIFFLIQENSTFKYLCLDLIVIVNKNCGSQPV